MTKIIGLCGKKQAGKDTGAEFLTGLWLTSREKIPDFWLGEKGYITDSDGNRIDCNSQDPEFIKIYNFADELKNSVSRIFNISLDLLNGTDKDKNTFTHLNWADMPGVITEKTAFNSMSKYLRRRDKLYGSNHATWANKILYHADGKMSVRDILQFFGTDICRSMYRKCWINATMNAIKNDSPVLAIIADVRFDDEAQAIYDGGGLNIKLMRGENTDSHASENGFVEYKDWAVVVHNERTDLNQFKKLFYDSIFPLGISPQVIVAPNA